ncbi:hypothetical protein FC777_13125 [Clostridium botulinum]|nr:hypothetical protein [Clostridium botulinum]
MKFMNKISGKRKILGCLIVFLVSLISCFSIKIMACSIPSQYVQKNIEKSMIQINRAGLYPVLPLLGANDDWEYNAYGQVDFFTELININSAYTIDSKHPIIESMRNPYGALKGHEYNPNLNLNSTINNENEIIIEAPQYWWGSMFIFRLLFSFLTYDEIIILLQLMFYSLLTLVLLEINKLFGKKAVFVFLIGILLINIMVVPFIINFSMSFIVGLISLLLVLKNHNNIENVYYYIIILAGVLTAFFDWMSTPLISLLLPTIFTLISLYNKNELRSHLKGVKVVVFSGIAWGLSYAFMLISKWILSAIILKNNIMDIVGVRISENLNNESFSFIEYTLNTFKRNLKNLLIFKFEYGHIALIIFFVFMIVTFIIYRKSIKELSLSSSLILVSLIPFAWFLVFRGHTYTHFWFTYRSILGSIIAILFAYIFSLDSRKVMNHVDMIKKIRKRV